MSPSRATHAPFLTFALVFALISAPSPAASASPLQGEALRDAREGLDHLYHARTEEARAAFERIRRRLPGSPAADFLLGGIEWHRVTTGPTGFVEGGAGERSFFARMDAAIELGERAVERDPDDLSARFFLGGAYGYEARYLAIQEKWWTAYRTGRHGVKHLEYVVHRDPDFADAYLGLGIYHYYTDVLPGIFRFLGTFVGIHGDRERGLREIRRSLAEGVLVQVEARFFLAELNTSFEEDHWEALGFSRSLRDEFPENELFTWLNARILDELHLTDLAGAEWRLLLEHPRHGTLEGFLDYRLARTRLFSGDFAGAAKDFSALISAGALGSRRITMWGHIRYGVCLDFLGRHEKAMAQYRAANALDASRSGAKRTSARLAAGRSDPARVSLAELQEMARILRATRGHGEDDLRRVEGYVLGPSRGLSRADRTLFFRVLEDLAEARLLRGDADGCLAAVDRALDSWQKPSKNERASLEALRAKALFRSDRTVEALDEWGRAYARASGDTRDRIEHERDLAQRVATRASVVDGSGDGATFSLTAPDRGELTLELEADFLPEGTRLPFTLAGGQWSVSWSVAGADSVRYRLTIDGNRTRIDPNAPRTELRSDGAWSRAALADLAAATD